VPQLWARVEECIDYWFVIDLFDFPGVFASRGGYFIVTRGGSCYHEGFPAQLVVMYGVGGLSGKVLREASFLVDYYRTEGS